MRFVKKLVEASLPVRYYKKYLLHTPRFWGAPFIIIYLSAFWRSFKEAHLETVTNIHSFSLKPNSKQNWRCFINLESKKKQDKKMIRMILQLDELKKKWDIDMSSSVKNKILQKSSLLHNDMEQTEFFIRLDEWRMFFILQNI